MSDLDDLGITPITDMQVDEALELLRQIRLSRRTPVKKPPKVVSKIKQTNNAVSSEMAAELLKILGGSQ